MSDDEDEDIKNQSSDKIFEENDASSFDQWRSNPYEQHWGEIKEEDDESSVEAITPRRIDEQEEDIARLQEELSS